MSLPMSSDEIAISAKNLSKTYRLFSHPGDRVKQFFSLGFKQYHRGFNALNDVSFEIAKGEMVGIIGRNGSGKSTLLQLVCGILKQTSGLVDVNGKVSALLELGSGFNPEFTGRENVFFQGTLMGLSNAQMAERFDDITAFADIGEFIDQPVRMYSSGMFVRLAFAVAISVDPDILVVDEALAVGDGAFQEKCLKRIDALRKRGGTILIVTHSLEQVAHYCDRALLLENGRLLAEGGTVEILAHYLDLLKKGSESVVQEEPLSIESLVSGYDRFSVHNTYNPKETRWGDRLATITDIQIIQNSQENPGVLTPGLPLQIRLSVAFHADIGRPIYGLAIKSSDGAMLFSVNSTQLLGTLGTPGQSDGDHVYASFTLCPFLDSGQYLLSVGVVSESSEGEIIPHDRRYDSIFLRFVIPRSGSGGIDMRPVLEILDAL
jgi:lipopolysaccharide transport system ATP-binding protein